VRFEGQQGFDCWTWAWTLSQSATRDGIHLQVLFEVFFHLMSLFLPIPHFLLGHLTFILCPFLSHPIPLPAHSPFPHYSLPPIAHPKSVALPHTTPQITKSQSPNPLTKHSSNHQLCLEVSHSRKYGIQLCFSIQAQCQPIPKS
jgi:hypothetical protein